MENKTVIITGTSSGYGKAIAKEFAGQGWNVVATMRSPEKERELTNYTNILVTRMDVKDVSSIQSAIEKGLEQFGQIDVLINNAAVGLVGVFEAMESKQIEEQFATNVFGYMNVIREILPLFRKQGDGMVVNVGSQGGLITFPLMSPYHATKFALEGFTESLAYELATIGVKVKLIEPGGANTSFFHNAMIPSLPVPEEYDRIINSTGMNQLFETYKDRLKTPEEVSSFIFHAVNDGTDQLRYLVGNEMDQFLEAKKRESDSAYIKLMRNTFISDVISA